MLGRLYDFRYFIVSSIRNEFRNRFARSKLGGFWVVISPLAQVAIYALILSNVFSARLGGVDNKYAYVLYLLSGLLGWTMFSEIMSRSASLFIDRGNLIKKVSFPRITLPAILLGVALINNAMLLLSILFLFAMLGQGIDLAVLWLIPITLLFAGFALSVGIILGIVNVFVRDVGQVVPILLQVWFWGTPIIYPVTIIPENYRFILTLNPVYPVIEAYHQSLVYGQRPDIVALAPLAVLTVLLFALALFLFRRANEDIVDAL